MRHFGLQLMEHTVKYRWTQISHQEKIFIKVFIHNIRSMQKFLHIFKLTLYDADTVLFLPVNSYFQHDLSDILIWISINY